MNEQMMLDVLTRSMWVATMCAAPLLILGGGVGLLISMLQAATQINEPAVAFVPKIGALALALVFMGPWLTDQLASFTTELYERVATIGGARE